MKKLPLLFLTFFCLSFAQAQPGDVKTMQETARTFMRSGDYDNAIIVLTRALQQDSKNLELQKDLVMSYYLKRDYAKALEGVKQLVDRDDADVMTYQIAGNVYKALEEAKDCERMYKKALKKFPESGPLLRVNTGSFYGLSKIFPPSNTGKKELKLTRDTVVIITMRPCFIFIPKTKCGA
jgi:tetratricopeptide (TPR) repeat protein